jgi:hypothetical protein
MTLSRNTGSIYNSYMDMTCFPVVPEKLKSSGFQWKDSFPGGK